MEKIVLDLAYAFTQVNPIYYGNEAINRDGIFYPQETENSFCAELYHQYKLVMESETNRAYYRRLILQFDILKLRMGIKPDLVLHMGQNNLRDQRLYVEVKTDPNAQLRDDLEKISIAVDSDLGFRNAVIIVVNKGLSNTISQIQQYFLNNPCNNIRKLFLFHSTINGRMPTFTFSEILNIVNE